MDKEQIKVIEELEGGTGAVWGFLQTDQVQPHATFYTRNKNTGEVVEMPNLPCDPYSLRRYLSRGFKLDKAQLEPRAVEQSQEGVMPGKSVVHRGRPPKKIKEV